MMRTGLVLFAATYEDDKPEIIEKAKRYIVANGYTQEQVKIADRDGVIVVVAK